MQIKVYGPDFSIIYKKPLYKQTHNNAFGS